MTFKWPDVTFTDTKCIGILKMKLIIIVMIKTSGIFKNMIVTSSTRTPSFCSDKNLSLVVFNEVSSMFVSILPARFILIG